MRVLLIIFICFATSVAFAGNYPLKASPNGRYLVDQNNQPFLCIGDAAHSLVVNLNDSDTWKYMTNRAAYGVNSIWVELLCVAYTGGRADGSLLDGTKPFTGTIAGGSYDFTKPNESYFARVDTVINMARSNNIQVFLDLLETAGWESPAFANGSNSCSVFGQYVGNRYKSVTNIFYMTGNDYQDWTDSAIDVCVKAIAAGVKQNDTNYNRLHTLQLDYPRSDSLEDSYWSDVLSVNGIYTYYPTYAQTLVGYNRTPFLPIVFLEAHYEFEGGGAPVAEMGTAKVLRRQEYWSVLAGSLGGHMYGSPIWAFDANWLDYLSTPGLTQLTYWSQFFSQRAWYNLVPDQAHSLVSAGYGTWTTNGYVSASDYVTAALATNGMLGMVYTPTNHTLTIQLTNFTGYVTSRWFDPTANSFTAITGSPFRNTGSTNLATPGNNSAGDADWVLLLESVPTNSPAVGWTAKTLNPAHMNFK